MRRLRAIDCKRPVNVERGPIPELRWLRLGQLVVDETYQRPITSQGIKTIREIVAVFDWRMFAPVVVCPIEGGIYAIVDGQHRATAALTCGIAEIPVLVIQADRVAQARAFAAINGRVTQVSTQQRFKASLAAGEPEALRLKAVADAADIVIVYYNTATANLKPRETVALDAIRRAVTRHGDEVARIALRAIVISSRGAVGYLRAATIRAVSDVLGSDVTFRKDEAQLLACFDELDLEALRKTSLAEAASVPGQVAQDFFQAVIVAQLTERLCTGVAA